MEAQDGGDVSVLDVMLAATAGGLGLAAWVAMTSAGAGRFSPPAAWAAGALLAVAMIVAPLARGWRPRPALADAVAIGVMAVAVWRIVPATTPWPAFFDSSWYVNTGVRIAREGDLTFRPDVLDVAPEARRALVSTFADHRAAGMSVPDDATRGLFDVAYAVPDLGEPVVRPYHPPFFASWVALWARLFGDGRAGGAVVPWALAYLLAVAACARAVFGPWSAPMAVAVVASGPAFAYYGRTPFAEMTAGALLLGGLAAMAGLSDRRPSPWRAFLGGVAIGLAVLAKVDVLPLAPVVGLWWVYARRTLGGRREGLALGAGLALPLAHGVVLARSVSALYVALNGGGVLRLARPALPMAAGLIALGVLAGVALWARRGSRRPVKRVEIRRVAGLLAILALGAATVAGWRVPDGQPTGMVPILSWLLTPLGLWAGAAGLVLALDDDDPRPGPLLAAAVLALPLVLAMPAITETLSPLYTARRLVPYAQPVVAILASGAGARIASEPYGRRARWVAVGGLALVLVSLTMAAEPFRRGGGFGGGPTVARTLAAVGGPRDVYLFGSVLEGANAGRVAAAMWNLEDLNTAVIAAPDTDLGVLSGTVASWRAEGRKVFVVADGEDLLPVVPGFELEYVTETSVIPLALAPSPSLPPRWSPLELSFVVAELVSDTRLP